MQLKKPRSYASAPIMHSSEQIHVQAGQPHGLPNHISSHEIHHKLPQRAGTYSVSMHFPTCLLSAACTPPSKPIQDPEVAHCIRSQTEQLNADRISGESETGSEAFASASEARSSMSERSSPSSRGEKGRAVTSNLI